MHDGAGRGSKCSNGPTRARRTGRNGRNGKATAAAVAGPTVTVTWDEALDEGSVPTGAGGFLVRIGTTNGPAVTAVSVSGSETVLTLASGIADGTSDVTLEYTPPSGAKVRDAAGNDATAITRGDPLDATVTPDTRAPEVAGSPTVDGTSLKVTFDEALDSGSVPTAPGGFTVTVTRNGSPVSGFKVTGLALSADGLVLTLTLSQAVRGGDAVTLAPTARRVQVAMVASTRSSYVPWDAVPIKRAMLVFHWCCPDGYNGTQQNLDDQTYVFLSTRYR